MHRIVGDRRGGRAHGTQGRAESTYGVVAVTEREVPYPLATNDLVTEPLQFG